LRTGRRVAAGVEVKFNPWHDPEDGRFTFAGTGVYFASGVGARSQTGRRSAAGLSAGPRDGIGGTDASSPNAQQDGRNDPKNPRNYGIYIVRRGDTLTRIAKLRSHIGPEDLAWLNDVPVDRPLVIGQKLKIPHQSFRDRGIEDWQQFRALDYYMETHGGRLPPFGMKLPPVESQILDSNWKQHIRGPYNFYSDILSRPRRMFGEVRPTSSPKRSRGNQRRAGGADRRPTDDGGHFAAPRLGGPIDTFNHFAQDRSLNRGVYRILEQGWYDAANAGHKVFIDIIPHYVGTSQRPDSVVVIWYIDGERQEQQLANEPMGRPNVR